MNIEQIVHKAAAGAVEKLYGVTDAAAVQIQKTRKEFTGDYTLVVFPLLKASRKSPDATASEIGEYLAANNPEVGAFNVIKGFLNISLKTSFWAARFDEIAADKTFGRGAPTGRTVMVEYSSPNTNKPLHLGHIRNNLLGWSVAEILRECGNNVLKANLVNDRGIHICKSMLAWQDEDKLRKKYAKKSHKEYREDTPENTRIKGDHIVGKYYVKFAKRWKAQVRGYVYKGVINYGCWKDYELSKEEICKKLNQFLRDYNFDEKPNFESELDKFLINIHPVALKKVLYEKIVKWFNSKGLLRRAQEMLRQWEKEALAVAANPAAPKGETYALWERMNDWVLSGFKITYDRLGVDFDEKHIYRESQTYLLGKSLVEEGLAKGVFYRRDDGSVWCDLTADGLDEKLLLRSDGTSVYMTQDLGTAYRRFEDENLDALIYVVGNEQNYHFQVLKLLLAKLGYPSWSDAIYHLSYGMVELPEGKMKSREGTVVDADDLIGGMVETAREMSRELGKLDGMSVTEAAEIAETVGLGALKYFILKVDPRKTMLFDPRESIDFNGNTGPFIQYTHARIRSVLRKATDNVIPTEARSADEESRATFDKHVPEELEIIKLLSDYPAVVRSAGESYSPSIIAAYAYDLAKLYNSYYHDHSILREGDPAVRAFRLRLSEQVATVIKRAMYLLGITVPERM